MKRRNLAALLMAGLSLGALPALAQTETQQPRRRAARRSEMGDEGGGTRRGRGRGGADREAAEIERLNEQSLQRARSGQGADMGGGGMAGQPGGAGMSGQGTMPGGAGGRAAPAR